MVQRVSECHQPARESGSSHPVPWQAKTTQGSTYSSPLQRPCPEAVVQGMSTCPQSLLD